jgi:glutamyl-tRNA reductase
VKREGDWGQREREEREERDERERKIREETERGVQEWRARDIKAVYRHIYSQRDSARKTASDRD